MQRFFSNLLLVVSFTIFASASFSQYVVNGSATQNSCGCFTLTQPVINQRASVWCSNAINLNNPFDFHFNVYLGCTDANGADGIVFVLHQDGLSALGLNSGGYLAFNNISPSIGVEIDTWQNPEFGDPSYDHIAINKTGSVNHQDNSNALVAPVQASATNVNIEDCQWHTFRVTWDPLAFLMKVYFDDSLRTQYSGNIVANIFWGSPSVIWGFTGATGGATNLQQVCMSLQADFATNISNNTTCAGNAVLFTDSSQTFSSIQNSYWDFGDGTTSLLLNPPPHFYPSPGFYLVKHAITGIDGCVSDTISKTITVGVKPVGDFTVSDACFKNTPTVIEQSSCSFGTINQWNWMLDGNVFSNSQQPSFPVLPTGIHTLRLVVHTDYGCVSDTATHNFTIKPIPQITMNSSGGCTNQSIQFNAQQTDGFTTINQWHWDFGDGNNSILQNPLHSYSSLGNYPVQLYALATNSCSSDTLQQFSGIDPKPVAVFQVGDTCENNSPIIINSSTIAGGSISQWNWILDGQSVSNLQIPVLNSVPAGIHQLKLIAASNGGCTSDTATHNFTIKNSPVISATGNDGCYRQSVEFNASQTDNSTTIQQWSWNFGDGQNSSQQNPSHIFITGGNYNVIVTVTASNGCVSQQTQVPVKINKLLVNAGNDTTVIMNVPFILSGNASSVTNGPLRYTWSPSTGLSNPNIPHPISILSDNLTYTLTVTSAEGCIATDQVAVEVFKGSGIYIPSGFTPNNDGLNDQLKPRYIGIQKLNYFLVYNRWGELIFSTTDMSKGWDGTYKGKLQNSGTFVWIVSAIDFNGKNYLLKGTTTIIR